MFYHLGIRGLPPFLIKSRQKIGYSGLPASTPLRIVFANDRLGVTEDIRSLFQRPTHFGTFVASV